MTRTMFPDEKKREGTNLVGICMPSPEGVSVLKSSCRAHLAGRGPVDDSAMTCTCLMAMDGVGLRCTMCIGLEFQQFSGSL